MSHLADEPHKVIYGECSAQVGQSITLRTVAYDDQLYVPTAISCDPHSSYEHIVAFANDQTADCEYKRRIKLRSSIWTTIGWRKWIAVENNSTRYAKSGIGFPHRSKHIGGYGRNKVDTRQHRTQQCSIGSRPTFKSVDVASVECDNKTPAAC